MGPGRGRIGHRSMVARRRRPIEEAVERQDRARNGVASEVDAFELPGIGALVHHVRQPGCRRGVDDRRGRRFRRGRDQPQSNQTRARN